MLTGRTSRNDVVPAMLIKDLINIPERIYANEFVIKLTEGIERPEETLDQYVVTAQLKRQYERALSLV